MIDDEHGGIKYMKLQNNDITSWLFVVSYKHIISNVNLIHLTCGTEKNIWKKFDK